jgi:hypothetical protein
MLIAKEMDGKIYVAQLGKTTGPDTAGGIPTWFFIGPGVRPTVVPYGEGVQMVLFDYLGVLNARLMSTTDWPPTQVDPTTYTPFISIQRSEDALAFSVFGSSAHGSKFPDAMVPGNTLQRVDDLIYDSATRTYTTLISRVPGFNPDPVTLSGWRLYSKPMGAPADQWVLMMDWTKEIANVPVTGTPKLQMDYCVSWGHLFNPDRPNDPWDRLESPKGLTFTLDSDVISKTLKTAYYDSMGTGKTEGESSAAWSYMDSKQMFFSVVNGSGVDVAQSSEGSLSFGLDVTMGGENGRGAFIAIPHAASFTRAAIVEGTRTGSFGRVEDRWMPTP